MNAPSLQENLQSEILDPVSRTSEILFGLIMVLTFTCSFSVVSAGTSDVREMLLGALGCNIAWGIIDGFFYLLNTAAQRGHEKLLISKLAKVDDQTSARELFQNVIPESIIGSISKESFNEIRSHLLQNKPQLGRLPITIIDFKAAFYVFLLVFVTTFPVALPFLLMSDPLLALRISNLIALILLFSMGFSLGRYAGHRPVLWGISMAVIGVVLVSLTIHLGG